MRDHDAEPDTLRHIIFDLDGTLLDSCTTCVAILSDILVERGDPYRIDPVAARCHMSYGGLAMVQGLLGPSCADPEADLAEFRTRYQHHQTPAETLFPGVAEGLDRLRAAGFTLSICSNKPQGLCEKVLMDTGLAGHFACIVGGQASLRPKPAPDLLKAVLAGVDALAGECLFVGDSELDHQLARNAGMPFYFLTHGYAETGWRPEDGAVFDDFAALTHGIVASRFHA